jgi:cell division protein FtsL
VATAHKSNAGTTVIEGLQSSGLPVALSLAAVIIGIAALLPLIQSSGATSKAGRVNALEEERTASQARLRELEVEVARLGSLDRIEQEARTRLGMEEPKETHFIPVDVPGPQPLKAPSRYLPAEPQHPHTSSSLWEDIFGWLPLP